MRALVRYTLQRNQGVFTAGTIAESINRTEPCCLTARDIRPILRDLHKLGEIRLAETSRGRKPHLYFKF